jgi:hypothetical protein
VCVCVCVCERERERERVVVSVSEEVGSRRKEGGLVFSLSFPHQ